MSIVTIDGKHTLTLDNEGLFDLLQAIKAHVKGVIVRCSDGYVVDSLGHNSVHVIVRPEPVVRAA